MKAASLLSTLASFDGRDTGPLQALRTAEAPTPELVTTLVELTGHGDNVAVGATWLLKAYLEDGCRLDRDSVVRLGETLEAVPDGHAALHICQMVRRLAIPEEAAESYADFARKCLGSSSTFVRAWAPDALHHLASRHPRFAEEAQRAIAAALADPAPSVRARARRITEGS